MPGIEPGSPGNFIPFSKPPRSSQHSSTTSNPEVKLRLLFKFTSVIMRELVTVQVGGFANFVGSHFWNFQDELLGLAADPNADSVFKNQYLDMDVLYRSGETPQGVPTYTPRLVSVDFQGSLGSMSSRGSLYNEGPSASSDILTWTGQVSTHKSEPRKKNLFLQRLYDEEHEDTSHMNVASNVKNDSKNEIGDEDIVKSLEDDVECWTDFSKVHYHPQSSYEIGGLWMDGREFDNYGAGRDVFSEGFHGEEISERLRFFVEECDHIQGFQFIVDDSGGFSAVAADFLENIADEYTNTPVLLYSARDPSSRLKSKSRKQTVSKGLHDAISFSRLSSFCKLIVPVGLPYLSGGKASKFLHIEDEKPYHSSAIYAATIHSLSLPFRMQQLGPAAESSYISGAMDVHRLTLTPEIAEDVDDQQAVESMVVHGALGSGGNRASVSEVKDSIDATYEHSTTRPLFCHLAVAQTPLPIPLPFPSIFSNVVGEHGELLDIPISSSPSRGSLDVHSIPMAARLRSSTSILPFLENRLSNLRRFGIDRGAPGSEVVRSWGFGKEDVEDMGENLAKLVKALDPDMGFISSDSD
ncbi:hypothetical protein ACFE04_022584 [Oxalis oulophora]